MTLASENVCARAPNWLVCASRTDTGIQRAHNEDRFGAFPEVGLFLVADGMGGAAAGEVAAEMVVKHVHQAVVELDVTWPTGWPAPGRAALPRLVAAIERANHHVHVASSQRPELDGMGTTVAAMLACGNRAVIAHVGDSRVYRLRGRRLDQLTEDHSLANNLIRQGLLDPERVETFAYRNVITRAIGSKVTVEVDARLVDVAPGDTFLLCSDGLSGVLHRNELLQVLVDHPDLDEAVQRLVDRANELGGPDNITAVAVRWEEAAASARPRKYLDAGEGSHAG